MSTLRSWKVFLGDFLLGTIEEKGEVTFLLSMPSHGVFPSCTCLSLELAHLFFQQSLPYQARDLVRVIEVDQQTTRLLPSTKDDFKAKNWLKFLEMNKTAC